MFKNTLTLRDQQTAKHAATSTTRQYNNNDNNNNIKERLAWSGLKRKGEVK